LLTNLPLVDAGVKESEAVLIPAGSIVEANVRVIGAIALNNAIAVVEAPPSTCKAHPGLAVPMPTLPDELMTSLVAEAVLS